MRVLPIVYISALLLGGCSVSDLPIVYQPDLQQGTVIAKEDVARLRPGMSREQVRFLMGTPSIDDPFHANRWDYVYSYLPRGDEFDERSEKRLTLYFDDDGLSRAEGAYIEPGNPLYSGS